MERDVREGFDRLEAKIDKLTEMIANHRVESAQNVAAVVASAKSAHKRLDDCEAAQVRRGSNNFTLWGGVFLALISSFLSWFFGGRKP